jgi:hypothetical protein
MGGTNDPSNLVELTVSEHAEAHRLLWEKYKNDPIRQKAHSERMKLWWDERRKVGT